MTGPYATGAPLYWKAGFTCPLPLAGKVLTVKGYTGHDGALVSWPDLQAWIETRSESNIGLRAAGWIGLDVDAYGAKVGAQSWASALAELGELPATVSSTARGPGQPSRIYLYRVPSAAVFDDAQRRFGEAFGPNVDVIHRSHRYIAVWPSLNPDAGGAPYRWYDPAGAVVDGVPELGQLPDLPEPWLEFLAGGTAASSERKAASPTLPGDPFTSPGHTPWTRSQMLAQVNPLLERLAANGRSGRTALDDLMAAALVTYRFVPAFMTREKADEVLLARLLERDQADGASDPTTWKWSARHELEKAWKDRAYEAEAADDPDPLDAPAGDDPGGARSERVIDLTPYLDGSYVPPTPSIGLERDDGKHLLYPGRWHTVMALTAAGKSWLALWHALEEIRRGNRVVYGHFEEGQPSGTISRLLQLGATAEEIGKLFTWVDCTKTWSAGEFGATMAGLETAPALVILDGINAACSQHGWPVNDPIAVGSYRSMFVTPAAATGAAVLSLGHPPKARDRQGERHGFGSTAWLDEVDGVGFRMRASKEPIGRGRTGHSALFTVKDRYGQVEALGRPDGDEDGWYYVGSFHIDDSPERRNTVARLSAPKTGDEGKPLDSVDLLALAVVGHLERTGLGSFASVRSLSDAMRARKIKFTASELPIALELLASRGVIDWPEVLGDRKPRPGSLIVEAVDRDS